MERVGRERLAAAGLPALPPTYTLPPVEPAVWGAERLSHSPGDFATIDRRLVAVELRDFAVAVRGGGAAKVDGE